MTLDNLVTITRARLAARERRVVPRGPLVQAAVLVPLVDGAASCCRRSERVGHPRAGCLSRRDPRLPDASLLEAALREVEESPATAHGGMLGAGRHGDGRDNFIITPFVG
jgi:hypothetical protein